MVNSEKIRSGRLWLGIFFLLFAIGFAWLWSKYPIIKANWPEIKIQLQRIKAIWKNEINVLDAEIKKEFFGLRLLITKSEVYQIIGSENFGEFKTDQPNVTGIILEREMRASNYGYDYWDKNGKGRNLKSNFWGYPSTKGEDVKPNPWIERINMELGGMADAGIKEVLLYFFGNIFYKIMIIYAPPYTNQVPWERFTEPTLKTYKLSAKSPSTGLLFNDGNTSLIMTLSNQNIWFHYELGISTDTTAQLELLNLQADTYRLQGDDMKALLKQQEMEWIHLQERLRNPTDEYYYVIYQNNRIAQDVEKLRDSNLPVPKL